MPKNRVTTKEEYAKLFPKDKAKEALKYALEIRKLEIDLYWKRASYFWLLITAAFTGYFALAVKGNNLLELIVASIGFVFSLSWYLVNRGSKYWQANWERHVDSLEDNHLGPLYKTIIAKDEFKWWLPWDGYPFSVSKINQLVSLYITLIWLLLLSESYPPISIAKLLSIKPAELFLFGSIIFAVVIVWFGRTKEEGSERPINFVRSKQKNEEKE